MTIPTACYDLPAATVLPGETANVISPPTSPRSQVRPVWIRLPDDVAPSLSVLDVKVGRNSQFVSTDGVPGTLFAESSVPRILRMDSIPPGAHLCVTVKNTGARPVTFAAKLVCATVQQLLPDSLYALGFGSLSVPPQTTRKITATPLIDFEPKFLHVTDADSFELVSLKTGPYLDVPNSPEVPPELLASSKIAAGEPIHLVPVPVIGLNTPLTIEVRNVTDRELVFRAAVLGSPVDDQPGE